MDIKLGMESVCVSAHTYARRVGGVPFFFFFSSPFSPQVNLAKLAITATDKAFKYLDTSRPNGIKTENFQANFPGLSRTAVLMKSEHVREGFFDLHQIC